MRSAPDLMGLIARAGAAIDPGLTDRDVESVVQGAARRRQQRARGRVGGAVAVAVTIAVVGVVFVKPLIFRTDPVSMVGPTVASLSLREGSVAVPLQSDSTLRILREEPRRVEMALGRGSARFDVVPRPERTFSVQAGDVTVTVLGTAFTLERVADRIGVNVERGTVRVDWKVGTRLLHKGESGWFPPLLVAGAAAPAPAPAPAFATAPVAEDAGRARAAPKHVAPREAPGDTAESLLAEADAQRMAGHAEQGEALLRRLLRSHPRDKRAPLAAFTLGRLLLIELDRPREAATAFAQVRALAPRGSFAEDALAREVEAWQRAGDADKVRARAREYVKLYPGGRRVDTVRILGELE